MKSDATPIRFAWTYVRTRGVRATVHGLVRRFVFARDSWILTKGDLPGPPAESDPHGIVFRRATSEDLANLDSLRPHKRPEELRARVLDEGAYLYVACDGPRVVGYRIAGRQPLRYSPAARYFKLGDREICTYEIFCHPDYRSRGVARRLRLASNHMLAQEGYRRRVSAIATDNIPSLRSSLGSENGTRPVLHVTYVRFLLYHRYRTSPELPAVVREIMERAASRARPEAGP